LVLNFLTTLWHYTFTQGVKWLIYLMLAGVLVA
jgi:hypothetical protein